MVTVHESDGRYRSDADLTFIDTWLPVKNRVGMAS